MSSSMNIVKADGVYRLSTVLKRWKRAWVVLYANGELSYFENKDSYEAKATIHVPLECRRIMSPPFTNDPPKNLTRDCMFGIVTNDSEWYFCADSSDDALSWNMALKEIKRVLPIPIRYQMPHQRGASLGYTDGVHYYQSGRPAEMTVPLYEANNPRAQPVTSIYRASDGRHIVPREIIEHPDGSRTIFLGQGTDIHCHCRRGHYCGCGYADAALFGLAATSLMWTPFLWSPFFWC